MCAENVDLKTGKLQFRGLGINYFSCVERKKTLKGAEKRTFQ